MRRCLVDPVGRTTGSRLPLLGAALVTFVFVLGGEQTAAAQGPGNDTDGDFLCAAQEQVLGTSPDLADTDLDGFSDLEELARGTEPTFASNFPSGTAPVNIGMTAHAGADDKVHILIAVHSTSPNPRFPQVRFGLQRDQRLVLFSNTWLAANSTLQLTTGSGGAGLVHLIDVAVEPASILGAGHLTYFATVKIPGSDAVVAADTVQLLNIDGVVVLVAPPPRPSAQQPMPANSSSIYVPLPMTTGGGIPSTWLPGSVCFQRAAPVAFNGAVMTKEVISATCVEGWDGYCPATCSSTVGTTFETIDPIALIGG